MNIGLVIYGSLDILTGGFLYDRNLVEFLRSTGDRVEVFAFPWRTYPSHLLQNFSRKFCSWCRSSHFDVLLEDELNHPSLFLANRRVKSLLSCPIIAIVHHLRSCEMRPSWQNRLYGAVERYFLQGVDGYIFPSFTTAATVESLVLDNKPFVVAHPGKDAMAGSITREEVQRRSFAEGPFHILFVGNLIPRKGLHVLIDGAALLPTREWRLKVVGSLTADRRYADYIRAKIKKYDLEQNVDLLGAVTGAELSDLYRASHVLAVPSSYEGFGIVYVEGMA
ncbi:MAG: glycosyltransferase family 4 protein, partial [Desulfomonilaceae bacterium]